MKFLEKSGELNQLAQDIQRLRLQKVEIEQQIANKKKEVHMFQESLNQAFTQCMNRYIPEAYWIQRAHCRNDASYGQVRFSLLLFHSTHVLDVYAYEQVNEEKEFVGYHLYFKILMINSGWGVEPKEIKEVKKQVETFILEEIESDHSKRLYTVTHNWLEEETDLITIKLDEKQQHVYKLLCQGVELYSAQKLAKLSHESFVNFKEQVNL